MDTLSVNGETHPFAVDVDIPLRRALRNIPVLTGQAIQTRPLRVFA